ncbi:MAG: TonB-dependent receptor [Thermoanaerobaculia bacterium]
MIANAPDIEFTGGGESSMNPSVRVIGNEMRLLVATALLVLAGLPALAQQGTTGELTGVVSAASAPLADITVTVTSASLPGSLKTTTGERGGYYFTHLPPGDYTVHFERDGLQPSHQLVRVYVAQTTRADASLVVASVSATISVAAPSEDSDQITSNFRGDLVEQLPTQRTLRDIALLAPSVNPNGVRNRLLIAGAPFWSSIFLVDGAVVNDNLGGQPHDLFIEEAIEETTVLTGAVSPEYGGFTGGVVSVRSRSGGDELRGSARTSLSNAAWTAATPWPGESRPSDDLSAVHELTLGGFVIRDRLWFFTAARFADQTTAQTTRLTNIAYPAATKERRLEGKLTGQLFGNDGLVVSYLDHSREETGIVGTPAGVLDLDALIATRSTPATFLTMGYHSMLPSNLFVEAQYARKNYALQGNGGLLTDRIAGTVVSGRRFPSANAPSSCGVCGNDQRNNESWLLKGMLFLQTRRGSHTLAAGAESFHEERIVNANTSSSDYSIQTARFRIIGQRAYPIFDETTVITWAPVRLPSLGTDFNTRSIFLNDRWDVTPRVHFSIGARYDRNDARDTDRSVVSNEHELSPRLSVTLDARGDGAHRIAASYGRYVSRIPDLPGLGSAAQRAGNPHVYSWRYAGPGINVFGTPEDGFLGSGDALAQLFAWFDSVGGVNNRQFLTGLSSPGLSTLIPQSLRSPMVDEMTLGYALRLGRQGSLRVDATTREWGGFYAARLDSTTGKQVDPEGNPIDVNWIVNDDSATSRTYRAVQVQGNWQVRSVRFGGGYTWSRLRGNTDGEGDFLNGEPATSRPLHLWYPELLAYPQRRPVGYLSGDQTHRARVWVGYDVAWGRSALNLSLLQTYDSGRAYSVVGLIDASGTITPYAGSPGNPGYSLTQLSPTGYPYYFSERGSLRTDSVASTDIALNYEHALGRTRLFFQGDVLNVLDRAAVTAPSVEVLTLLRSGRASGLTAFNPFTTKPIEGVHYLRAPDFGKPTGPSSYQTPRTYRFSIGARF